MQPADIIDLKDATEHVRRRLDANPALWDRIEAYRRASITSLRFAQLYAGEAASIIENRGGGPSLLEAMELLEAATAEARANFAAVAQITLCEGEA